MKLIAHRGNRSGVNEGRENEPTYIMEAINYNYDVEVDVWYVDGVLYLGHDKPTYEICPEFLTMKKEGENVLWCHLKNHDAIAFVTHWNFNNENDKIHYFWHQEDDMTITSEGYHWVYPGKSIINKKSILLCFRKDYDVYIENIFKDPNGNYPIAGICHDDFNEVVL